MNYFRSKFGKEAPQSFVGLLVVTIALLILLYMIFLPECDKCDLLGEDCPDYCDDLENEEETLLLESPGIVDENPSNEITHDLGTINLYIRNEPEIKDLSSSLNVYKGLFGELDQDLSFSVKDVDNIDKVTLNFNVLESKGTLIIQVNGKEIFSENTGNGPQIVEIPTSYLSENNKLRISVNSPGIVFWAKNSYDLSDVKVKSVFEVVQAKQTKTFTVSQQEDDNAEDVVLKYSGFCRDDRANNILTIFLNGNQITSSPVDCFNNDRTIDISEGDLREGSNEIIFTTTEGDFSLDDTEIEVQLKSSLFIEYEFDVDKEDFDDYFITLELNEVDEDQKSAELIINGKSLFMDTTDSEFEEDISSFIKDGTNRIKIKPSNEFEIEELRIWGE